MSAIAYRDGILAADSQLSDEGILFGTSRKITRDVHGNLAGAAGDSVACAAFLRWFESARTLATENFDPKATDGHFGALIISADDKTVRRMDTTGRCVEITAEFHAEGHPFGMLIGAMAAGASAIEAVEIAIKYDRSCGGPIQVESLIPRGTETAEEAEAEAKRRLDAGTPMPVPMTRHDLDWAAEPYAGGPMTVGLGGWKARGSGHDGR